MKYALFAYVVVVALALTLKPAPASKGPECGPGVLCIRPQKQVQAALEQASKSSPQKDTTHLAVR